MIHAQVGSSLVSRHYPAILLAVFREEPNQDSEDRCIPRVDHCDTFGFELRLPPQLPGPRRSRDQANCDQSPLGGPFSASDHQNHTMFVDYMIQEDRAVVTLCSGPVYSPQ
ncbi:unnamed protein product [Penicillium camemberti]|uniref:Str. FM013 n=1 Tax=Penicillium camemberti (strain FM 013) TaxID=1429867 RepID=A0A0G4PQH8_PENC3|nr:unnamed protein product [Penicillium camemberti]